MDWTRSNTSHWSALIVVVAEEVLCFESPLPWSSALTLQSPGPWETEDLDK